MTQIEAAKIQLEHALRLFVFEHDYVSSLTLAGAVEGILGGLRRKRHEEREKQGIQDDRPPNAFEERKALYAWLNGNDSESEKENMGRFIRKSRNAMHHPGGNLEGDLREEAEEWISMAISDLVALTGEFSSDDLYVAFCNATEAS
jgi:hypothetical protein